MVAGGITVVKQHYPFPPLTETNGLAGLFDSSTLTWKKTNSLNQSRAFETMTVLSNGQVLVAGGKTFNKTSQQLVPNANAELYAP